MKPWEYHADLSEDRLIVIGQKIADARNAVIDQIDEHGDDSWSIGCRAFAFCRNSIIRAAVNGEYTWLSIMDPSNLFIFQIGQIPTRFFRGASEEPLNRTLSSIDKEKEQFSLIFPGEKRVFHLIWRFVAETDLTGDLTAVWFIGATPNGIPECRWEIPIFDAAIDGLESLLIDEGNALGRQSNEEQLPAPSISLPHNKVDDAAGE